MSGNFSPTQLGRRRTQYLLSHSKKFKLVKLGHQKEINGLGLRHDSFTGVYDEGRVRKAFHIITQVYSQGTRGGLAIEAAAALCEDDRCVRGQQQAEKIHHQDEGSDGAESPAGPHEFPVAVYVGQFKKGRADVLVVFERGPSLVFTQTKTGPIANSSRSGR